MSASHKHFNRKFNTIRDDEYLDRITNERGLIGYLSNTKWVKLLTALVAHSNLIKECQVKLIWEEQYTGRKLLIDENTSYWFDYYDKAMEAMITGKPSGWYDYREIEWLAFPRHPAGTDEQNLEEILTALTSVGQLPFVAAPDYLRLDAYRAVAA